MLLVVAVWGGGVLVLVLVLVFVSNALVCFFLVTQLGSLGWMRGVVFPTWLALISMLFTFLESRMQYYQVYYI